MRVIVVVTADHVNFIACAHCIFDILYCLAGKRFGRLCIYTVYSNNSDTVNVYILCYNCR